MTRTSAVNRKGVHIQSRKYVVSAGSSMTCISADSRFEIQLQSIEHPHSWHLLGIILLISLVLSNPMLVLAGSGGVPYEEGDRQEVPSGGARICDVFCTQTYGGALYSFRIEVFETCWEPVYSIEIEQLEGTSMEPVSCPNGWMTVELHGALHAPGRLIFSTDTQPIRPGTDLGGFGVLARSPETVIRWYPTDSEGILIGKVTRLELSCSTRRGPATWGTIKSLYR